jgi:alpha-galactosidase
MMEGPVSLRIWRTISRGFLYGVTASFALTAFTLHAQLSALRVSIGADGSYSIGASDSSTAALTSGVAAEIGGRWIHSSQYPHHTVTHSSSQGYLGAAQQWQVAFSGLSGEPDLIYRLRAYTDAPFADIQLTVQNSTGKTVNLQAIRSVEASGGAIAELGGPPAQDRVLSDSFSEDRPVMKIHDLGDAEHNMHRAVGSQLIYNTQSQESLFLGALTSERFLTVLRIHLDASGDAAHIARYEVDSTGTTELEKENSLQNSPAEDWIELSLPVAPGGGLSSECVAIAAGKDYHHSLETYGALIRQIHHARISAPPLMGWWSWTAYYFGLNQDAALTNAAWEAEHLKQYGYDVFHIDEGYQYARGEYVTPDATLFPHGLTSVEYKVRGLGLTPGIWTAPLEVSERSAVYQQHPDWLVKNARGKPIHAGNVVDGKDQLYILDTTNPGAQEYLRETYRKLVDQWGLHYIKMDFMDDSAIEGYYYKPHTTAMEAQRIGLQIIRDTVGNDVYLDKDGSVMMNPVGYVDYGRISQDTGHSFGASRDAATGIAARYYMNRNFFVADPDAFTVSTQRISDQSWHEGKQPLTLAEARVSIALAAVSGGMLEIGDNLPSFEKSPERIALIENQDLIDMVRLGKASMPIDLMSYAPSDEQPSIFLLKESPRQSILTVFNWTEHSSSHSGRLTDLGLPATGSYTITGVFDQKNFAETSSGALQIDLPAHSVCVLKILDQNVRATPLVVEADGPANGKSGDELAFSAKPHGSDPVLSYRWDFGDGVQLEGAKVSHAWTEPGDYEVHLTAIGLDGSPSEKLLKVHIAGYIPTAFNPSRDQRLQPR